MNPVEPCRCIMPDEYFSQAHDPLDPLWTIASPMPFILPSVTALSASFAVVTDSSARSPVLTAPSAMVLDVMAPSAICEFLMLWDL